MDNQEPKEGILLSDEEHEAIIKEVAKRDGLEQFLFHTKPNEFNFAISKAQHLKTVKAVFEAMDKILRQTEYQGVFSCWESNYEALKKQLQAKNG